MSSKQEEEHVMSKDLLEKAELLMELEGYERESVKRSDTAIDLKVSKPDSDETVLMHIVTDANSQTDTIGANKVKAIKQLVEREDVDKLIVFGEKFSTAAKKELKAQKDIDFFSEEKRVFTRIAPIQLYSIIMDYVNQLCQLKCGAIPTSTSDCHGYTENPRTCSSCGGSGRRDGKYLLCNTCRGTGFETQHYSCTVRLISDNADYLQQNRWLNLLQNDLQSLITLHRREKQMEESEVLTSSDTRKEVT
jgi:hypothetical protein